MANRAELMAAYSAACFDAATPVGLVTLQIGQKNDGVARLYKCRGASSAAYLTAWNPMSVPQTLEQNEAAQAQLIAHLHAHGLTFYEGSGRDPTGQWPPEKSLLIIGISAVDACALGRRYAQAAVVIVAADAVPRLMWVVENGLAKNDV